MSRWKTTRGASKTTASQVFGEPGTDKPLSGCSPALMIRFAPTATASRVRLRGADFLRARRRRTLDGRLQTPQQRLVVPGRAGQQALSHAGRQAEARPSNKAEDGDADHKLKGELPAGALWIAGLDSQQKGWCQLMRENAPSLPRL